MRESLPGYSEKENQAINDIKETHKEVEWLRINYGHVIEDEWDFTKSSIGWVTTHKDGERYGDYIVVVTKDFLGAPAAFLKETQKWKESKSVSFKHF